ncbi:MAG: hypothetical protein ILA13_00465 [Eubacterium sp.]|nr:hypothetical protein [Eubacterium sp.]
MEQSVTYLINKYISSKNYKEENWYRNLSSRDKCFVDNLDKAVEEGIVKGLSEYKEGGRRP